MSALAQALLDSGFEVSGSDRLLDSGGSTPVLDCLKRQGVALFAQDGSGVDSHLSRLVISSAIESDNPELISMAMTAIQNTVQSSPLQEASNVLMAMNDPSVDRIEF